MPALVSDVNFIEPSFSNVPEELFVVAEAETVAPLVTIIEEPDVVEMD